MVQDTLLDATHPHAGPDPSLAATLLLGSSALAAAAIGETLVAPPPAVEDGASLAGAGRHGVRAVSMSVLPRLELDGDALQLAPANGPRYAPVRPLGRGGMGEVDLVEDRDIGRAVALKRLLPQANQPGHLARFVDEVRVIGRLEHPNIVPIHDVGLDDSGRYFFVMKYVDGETLESVIERLASGDAEAMARYDVARRVQIFVGLLRALEYAHAAGVLHRDLKPANVMVGRFGEVVLMDWGVACTLDQPEIAGAQVATPERVASARLSSTQAGALVGTPHYMSPEQTKGAQNALDVRSDLYSACVLFHELLGLRHRHAAEQSLLSVLTAVLESEPPALAAVFPPHPSQPGGVGAEYAHFIRRGLARDPNHRWQTARQMIEELHSIQSGFCRIQCPVTLMKRTTSGVAHLIDRRPYAMMAASATGLLGILALIGFFVSNVTG